MLWWCILNLPSWTACWTENVLKGEIKNLSRRRKYTVCVVSVIKTFWQKGRDKGIVVTCKWWHKCQLKCHTCFSTSTVQMNR